MRHLLLELTSAEIVEWEAFYQIDPWGEERADIRSAIIAWTFALAHSKKGHKPKLEHFMPNYERAIDKKLGQTDRDFARNLIAAHRAFGGIGEIPEDLKRIAGVTR